MIEELEKPVSNASLMVFRMLFGVMMAGGMARFILSGWVETQFVAPSFFFKFYGFEWVKPLSQSGMYGLLGTLIVLALLLASGVYPRMSAALFAVGFAWLQLVDVTNYLNHYYFVVLLALWMAFLPLSGKDSVPKWALYALRAQVAIVYVHAGLAKFGSDWLLHAQPLGIWLGARTEIPILGAFFGLPGAAYFFSWAGFLYDTLIVFFLLWRKTRTWAYLTVIVFHALTGILFNIGMFPFIMVVAATLFFEPDWPLRFWKKATATSEFVVSKRTWPMAVAACVLLFQAVFPLRHLLYPGDVLWNEEGMRFSWKVMVREKNGSVTFHVKVPSTGKVLNVHPSEYLLPRQEVEMSAQPDLILKLAHHIADDFRKKGFGDVEVRAEAWVSLNGRPPALLVDPTVDLAAVDDGLEAKPWILPLPKTQPVSAFLWSQS